MAADETTQNAPLLDPTGSPIASPSMEESYDHVIVGGGMAAVKAVEGIREVSPEATVAVVSEDVSAPVYRPDLSKRLWAEDEASVQDSVLVTTDEKEPAAPGVDTHYLMGVEVSDLDPEAHTLVIAGKTISYGSLLLATGSEPITGETQVGARVHTYRTASDFRRLHGAVSKSDRVVVVGGGYIGTELAAALTGVGAQVTLVSPRLPLLSHMLPEELAEAVQKDYEERGVRVVEGRYASVAEAEHVAEPTEEDIPQDPEPAQDGSDDPAAAEETGEQEENLSRPSDYGLRAPGVLTVTLEDGTELNADRLVLSLGVQPRTELAEFAGITVDDGVVVDQMLQTSAQDVYAAGDIASYPDALLGTRRVEHADAAETQGLAAGGAMAGQGEAYTHTPFFWGDLFDAGYEAIGEITTDHTTVVDLAEDASGAPDTSTAVVYYVDGGTVRGVLLWNVWDSVPKAEELMRQTKDEPVEDPEQLKGRIPLG
ncbi:NAD(P)/FAD-dependent oxidoreductase [Micrococcus lylae]|uniref:NAD(P)/FAD-dependent oxidoreductase n=1 Tax=Micrococcus lylae TaxID=1273 RepID=UPI003EBA2446